MSLMCELTEVLLSRAKEGWRGENARGGMKGGERGGDREGRQRGGDRDRERERDDKQRGRERDRYGVRESNISQSPSIKYIK